MGIGRFLHRKKDDNRLFFSVLGVAAVISGATSLWIGLRQSVWFDEDYSIELAREPLSRLFQLTAHDVHPPFSYLLLKGWGSVFGWQPLSLRLLSVLLMVGALVVGGLLIRKMFDTKKAIAAVLLVMIAPLLLRYGFEIRMYSLASLIGVSATYMLYSAWQEKNQTRKKRWLVAYGLLVALGIYTLYYLALLWIAHVAWLLCMKVKHTLTWKKIALYGAPYIGAAVLFIPWLPTFLPQFTNGALGPAVQPLKLDQLVSIATFNTFYQPVGSVNVPLTMLFVLVIVAVVWSIMRAKKLLARKSDEITLLVAYIVVPIVIVMLISLLRPMYMERYLSHVAIGLIMLIGVVVAMAAESLKYKPRMYFVIVPVYGAVLVGAIHLATIGNYSFQYSETPVPREVAASITDCDKSTTVLAVNPYTASELMYYMPQCHVYFLAKAGTLGGGFAPLDGNPYQVEDPASLSVPRIAYVSSSAPDQPISSKYEIRSTQSFGSEAVTIEALKN